MSEPAPAEPPVQPHATTENDAPAPEPATVSEAEETKVTNGETANGGGKEVATDAPVLAPADAPASTASAKSIDQKQTTDSEDVTQDKPSAAEEDVDMKDSTPADDGAPAQVEPAEPTTATPVSAVKAKTPRRKSTGVPEHKGRKLNKKASMPKMTHVDAQPGDYFYVRLKGYPLWPAIVCDESMLPNTLVKNRPVTAARPDGTYRADYEDGGPKAKDRTFPVMYLHTNEFGWIPNYDLVDLDFDEVGNVPSGLRKDLAAARLLAAEKNDLDYFKDILTNFMQQREADRLAKEAAKAEKKAAKKEAAKTSKGKKSDEKVTEEDDVDIEMADAVGEPDSDEVNLDPQEKKKDNKRKAEDTPQRADSVKKPRQTIKLNTPKNTNGTATPKSTKDTASKPTKVKAKKPVKAAATPEVPVPKEPELTAEEKRAKKEKEILFLRHKLQKGLLTRDQEPKEEEMKGMSEFVSKLEGYADLEVSIIRATKINKVLKAILKLSSIPKEDEFNFKTRSQSLLDKWNKLLASESTEPSTSTATTNGNSTEPKADAEDAKASPVEVTNGTKESSADDKLGDKSEEKSAQEAAISKASSEDVAAASAEEPIKESIAEPTPVESSA